jgi:hypothetical protein
MRSIILAVTLITFIQQTQASVIGGVYLIAGDQIPHKKIEKVCAQDNQRGQEFCEHSKKERIKTFVKLTSVGSLVGGILALAYSGTPAGKTFGSVLLLLSEDAQDRINHVFTQTDLNSEIALELTEKIRSEASQADIGDQVEIRLSEQEVRSVFANTPNEHSEEEIQQIIHLFK